MIHEIAVLDSTGKFERAKDSKNKGHLVAESAKTQDKVKGHLLLTQR